MLDRKVQTIKKEMIRHTVALQERLLQEAMPKKGVITLILVNGFHIKGTLKGYDRYAVWIEADNKSQLVYKHAISTIRF
ncbi:RNA chaperone Hfq [Bacillus sp. SRB3LM]|uniref:RNA chaperone Hfq n=1 Tax=Bacillus sp. SRB3LM TaxID=2608689 RepID=UPI0018C39B95|nr:RNA chaperone Hfq [Bacillus sp. SRB3LM]MBG0969285.1 RNA chaperone Hfq [Bacillus sp. SRB3LM]MBG0972366.1 RNA chaperone Hfq [Bacillus sp. SRB3LM]